MKSLFFHISAVIAFGLVLFGTPQARAALVGTQGFDDSGSPTATPNDITLATTFNIGDFGSTLGQTGIFVGMPKQDIGAISFNVTPVLHVPFPNSSFTFTNAVFGTFTSTEIELTSVVTGTNASVSYTIEGNWTTGSIAPPPSTVAATMTFSATQTGGPGKAISDSATFTVPAIPLTTVPEPSSMVLLVVGAMGGLGAWWRKRRQA